MPAPPSARLSIESIVLLVKNQKPESASYLLWRFQSHTARQVNKLLSSYSKLRITEKI